MAIFNSYVKLPEGKICVHTLERANHFMSCVSLIHLDAEDRDLEKQAFVFGFKIVWKKNKTTCPTCLIPSQNTGIIGIGKGLGMRKRTFDHIIIIAIAIEEL